MYLLLDANLAAGYYLPRSLHSVKASERIHNIVDSVRSDGSGHFLYIPNFCIAETFSVFAKHSYGIWNNHLKNKATIDTRVYNSIIKQFGEDIHNGSVMYHYELSRYHILSVDLVSPIDHYFQITKKSKKKYIAPAGTFDHLIISMGIHLAHIHGSDNVCVLTTDDRLSKILDKCKSHIPAPTIKKLKLNRAHEITGKKFGPDIFPKHLNLKHSTKAELTSTLGSWPLVVNPHTQAYRWTNP